MNSLIIIKYLLNNNIYIKYNNILYLNKDSKELVFLYKCLKELHDKYNKDITVEEYTLYVLSKCNEDNKDTINELLNNINNTDLNNNIVEDIITDLRNKQLAYDLTNTGIKVLEDKASIEDVLSIVSKFDTKTEQTTVNFVNNDLETLYNESVQQAGLRWRLSALNSSLGSLRRGDFGFIFARPETGKTTFIASEISNFATQSSAPILWFNNEEQGSKVMLRCYQAMLGITQTQLFGDINGNTSSFKHMGGDKIRIFDSAAIHRKQVEQLARELQPGLIVFDQLDKIKGFDEDRDDLRLGAIYIWAREIAKEYCPVIAVSQADASGEGKKWLTMDNVAGAKTAKQAEADWIIGIGKTHNDADEYTRFLNICKNKLAGDPDSDPELRHGKLTVSIQPSIGRYIDNGVDF